MTATKIRLPKKKGKKNKKITWYEIQRKCKAICKDTN